MRYFLLNKDTVWLEFRCERNEYLEVTAQEEAWHTGQRPFGYTNLTDFLERRKAPKHQLHIAELLVGSWTAAWMCDPRPLSSESQPQQLLLLSQKIWKENPPLSFLIYCFFNLYRVLIFVMSSSSITFDLSSQINKIHQIIQSL